MARYAAPSTQRDVRALLALLCVAGVGRVALNFVQPPAAQHSRAARRGGSCGAPGTARACGFSWDADVKPEMPGSPEEMIQQAADAVMRAYREGNTRQTVRLRLDQLFDMESTYLLGTQGLLNATLPLAQRFAKKIWGGDYLKELRTSLVDDQVGMLLYREAEYEMQDAAIFYLPGRSLLLKSETQSFFSKMKDRLVVLANTENAPFSFKVELMGQDWPEVASTGRELCKMFSQQSYYFSYDQFNSWQMYTFRSYPYPWEIYIENLDYELVKLMESDRKPGYNELIAAMEEYEAKNGIRPVDKIAKILKDTQEQEQASEEAAPGWRAQASGEDLKKQARIAEEGRKLAEQNAEKEGENANA